jgi:hypothetical protein
MAIGLYLVFTADKIKETVIPVMGLLLEVRHQEDPFIHCQEQSHLVRLRNFSYLKNGEDYIFVEVRPGSILQVVGVKMLQGAEQLRRICGIEDGDALG